MLTRTPPTGSAHILVRFSLIHFAIARAPHAASNGSAPLDRRRRPTLHVSKPVLIPIALVAVRLLFLVSREMPPLSRQERRKAERDAAKRAPGQAGAGAAAAAGGATAAAASANVNMNMSPVGDWTTQRAEPSALFRALGANIVKQRASAGDREAQFSQGFKLVSDADGAAGATALGAAGKSLSADVGLTLCTAHPVAHHEATYDASMRPPTSSTTKASICGCRPRAEEGLALLEKAAGQGHAYAMVTLGSIHHTRKDHGQVMRWTTRAAEAGGYTRPRFGST